MLTIIYGADRQRAGDVFFFFSFVCLQDAVNI